MCRIQEGRIYSLFIQMWHQHRLRIRQIVYMILLGLSRQIKLVVHVEEVEEVEEVVEVVEVEEVEEVEEVVEVVEVEEVEIKNI